MKRITFAALVLFAILSGCQKNSSTAGGAVASPKQPAPSPTASFKITNGFNGETDKVKEGVPLAIQNTSQNAQVYYWDFGNGNYSTDKEPAGQLLYPCTSNQAVKLTVVNKDGVSSTITQSYYVVCYRSAGGRIVPGNMPANWPQH